MNQNVLEPVQALNNLNEKYIGWYMFLLSGALPGKAKCHALSKSKVTSDGIREIVQLLKESAPLFHLDVKHKEFYMHPTYFIFKSEGSTLQYKTLALVIHGESLDGEGKRILDAFLRSGLNLDLLQKYSKSAVRHSSNVFRLNMRGKNSLKIHETDPAFEIRDED